MPTTTQQIESITSDRAVSTEEEDEFQRYPFAKRIADTIRNRQDASSLVLGLYGKWGSGKSSIINFIVNELAGSQVLTMVFNPWSFSDEEQLLLGFFSQFIDIINSLDATASQAALDTLAEYHRKSAYRLASIGPEATEEQFQALKSQASLEGFKHQLSELLQRFGKRILILIDDLDRLDKREVQAMLRLVKLTGDFSYTTYLLAFDEAMVARALGERYPGGGQAAGRRFLEKIIQVPLRLPVIQKEAMLRYFEKQLNRCLLMTDTSLAGIELSRLTNALSASVMSREITPRDVSRYINTLSVVMPLLRGEANMTDLMLVEALKIFFPASYKLAAANQGKITGILQRGHDRDLHKYYDVIFGEKASKLGDAKDLFFALFPLLRKLYAVERGFFSMHSETRTDEELYQTKSIASTYYFRRYFSYAVQEGEIPDNAFSDLLTALKENDVDKACGLADIMISRSSDEEFFRRIQAGHTAVVSMEAESYCKLIVRLSGRFSLELIASRFMSMFARVPGLLIYYIERLPEAERIALCEYVILESSLALSYNFLFTIHEIIRYDVTELEATRAFFTLDRYQQLAQALTTRILPAKADQALYKTYENSSEFLFRTWKTAYGSEPVDAYLKSIIDKTPEEIKVFLRYMAQWGTSGNTVLYGHLTKDAYDIIASIFDIDYLYRIACQLIGTTEPMPHRDSVFDKLTDEERLHELVYWHDAPPSETTSTDATIAEE